MLAVVATALAVVAAVRGMWSPCGLSMLSTMTPMAEQLRGHRFSVTTSWFVFGALLGGASLGFLTALGAALVRLAHPTETFVAIVALSAGLVCLLADSEVGGIRLPAIRRQVNERWVEQYRPSVYAAGFGWQLGAGFTTYVMTSANYLIVILAIASGSPLFALLLCLTFGATRGLVLLANAKVTSTEQLFAMHRFLEVNEELSKVCCLVAESVVLATAAVVLFGPTGVSIGVVSFAVGLISRRRVDVRTAQQELVVK